MKPFKIIIVLVNILLVISLYCCVPDEVILHGNISGYVTTSETSEPLNSASIELNQSNITIDTTSTGNDGSYLIKNISPGNYELEVSKSTFEKKTKNVNVVSTKTSNINFEIRMLAHPLISDSYLDFGLDSVTRTFTISNAGAGTLRYSLFTNQNWIVIDSKEGEITTETDTIEVAVSRTGLSGKKDKGEIYISYYVGNELEESILEVLVNGVMDIDGNYYGAVTIGSQTWLSENLNTGESVVDFWHQPDYDNGKIDRYCICINDCCDVYGGGYQWPEMMDYPGVDDTTGMIQGICPAGWHIPSLNEWLTLIEYLGGVSVAGGMLKDTGTIEDGTGLWKAPNTGASNHSGFTALPGGSPYRDPFATGAAGIGELTEFWTSSKNDLSYPSILLWWNRSEVSITTIPTQDEYQWPAYVRCIKDPE